MVTNAKRDWITKSTISSWGDNYAGHKERDAYINPVSAPDNWWSSMKVRKVLVLYGEYEIARDSINTWLAKFKVSLNP